MSGLWTDRFAFWLLDLFVFSSLLLACASQCSGSSASPRGG